MNETCIDCLNKNDCDLYKSLSAYEKHSVNAIRYIFGIHIVKICKNFEV